MSPQETFYELKQSPRIWYYRLHHFLIEKGYKRLRSDPNLYTRHDTNNFLILAVYVDDILIISNNVSHIEFTKQELASTFSITDGGPLHYMLGIEFNKQGDSIHSKYAMYNDYVKGSLQRIY